MWRSLQKPVPRPASRYRRWQIRFRSLLWATLSLVGISASAAATNPPQENPPSVSLEARVEAVRNALAEQHQPVDDRRAPARTFQWGNWPNWGNWNNWPNWGNWNNY